MVETHKRDIEKILEENRAEIEAGTVVVYMIDECHLLWGDVCGYVWGKTNKRIEVPMTNQRERQSKDSGLSLRNQRWS